MNRSFCLPTKKNKRNTKMNKENRLEEKDSYIKTKTLLKEKIEKVGELRKKMQLLTKDQKIISNIESTAIKTSQKSKLDPNKNTSINLIKTDTLNNLKGGEIIDLNSEDLLSLNNDPKPETLFHNIESSPSMSNVKLETPELNQNITFSNNKNSVVQTPKPDSIDSLNLISRSSKKFYQESELSLSEIQLKDLVKVNIFLYRKLIFL